MSDAIVVGAGPNGLAAAIVLARAGHSVRVLEAAETVGGGARSAELTLPGFVHDVCSAIHPLGVASPFFRTLPLAEHGVEWIDAPAALAHPFDDGTAALLERTPAAAVAALGEDERRWRRLFAPARPRRRAAARRRPRTAAHAVASVAARALRGSSDAAGVGARAAVVPRREGPRPPRGTRRALDASAGTAAERRVRTGARHARSRRRLALPAGRLAAALRRPRLVPPLGGEIETGRRVESLAELGATRPVLLDVTPRGLLALAGGELPSRYRRRLERYRYGPGVFKLDLALDGPIPWRAEECSRAATVHLGPTLDEIAASEAAAWSGEIADRPYVLLAQQSLVDPTRAPAGKHTVWAYCHVPNGSSVDMTERIERQIERFAPGFRDRILARSVLGPAELERHNANIVGGDINGGAATLSQLFTRPVARLSPYTTPLPGVFLCSASTPPGGGVHGMCGYHAAQAALRFLER